MEKKELKKVDVRKDLSAMARTEYDWSGEDVFIDRDGAYWLGTTKTDAICFRTLSAIDGWFCECKRDVERKFGVDASDLVLLSDGGRVTIYQHFEHTVLFVEKVLSPGGLGLELWISNGEMALSAISCPYDQPHAKDGHTHYTRDEVIEMFLASLREYEDAFDEDAQIYTDAMEDER